MVTQQHLRRARRRRPQHLDDRALPADPGEPDRHLLVPLRGGERQWHLGSGLLHERILRVLPARAQPV